MYKKTTTTRRERNKRNRRNNGETKNKKKEPVAPCMPRQWHRHQTCFLCQAFPCPSPDAPIADGSKKKKKIKEVHKLPAPSKGCQLNRKGWLIDTLYEPFGTLWKVQVSIPNIISKFKGALYTCVKQLNFLGPLPLNFPSSKQLPVFFPARPIRASPNLIQHGTRDVHVAANTLHLRFRRLNPPVPSMGSLREEIFATFNLLGFGFFMAF